jgi:hypothetical protein
MRIKKKTYLLWKKIVLGTCILVVVFSLGYIYFKTSVLSITSYELVGVPDENKELISLGVQTISTVPKYKIFPTNRIISYRSNEIKAYITKVLPDTQTITIRPVSLHTLRITLTQYSPAFRVDQIHAISGEGIIYQEQKPIDTLPILSIASSTQTIIDKDGISITQIHNLPENFLSNLTKLISQVNSTIFTVSKINLDSHGDVTLSNELASSTIKFSSKEDIKKVWSNLVSAIDTEPLKSKLANSKNKLEYLDTRFGNKVFFKFTNEGKTIIMPTYEATSTATTTVH